MYKILHISKYFYPHIGGVERTCLDNIEAVSDKAIQKVICFNDKNEYLEEKIAGVDVIRIPSLFVFASQDVNFRIKHYFKKIIKEFDPDYIYFHYPNPLMLRSLLRIKYRAKLILHWHLDITRQKFLKLFFEHDNKIALKKAYKIVANSEIYRDNSNYLKKYKDKVTVITPKVENKLISNDDPLYSRVLHIRNEFKGKKICYFIGRHVEYKGIRYLVEAFKKIKNENIILLIAGKGKLTEELMKEASNCSNIIFLGKLNDEDCNVYLNACDIFTFPSITKNESFGLALAEALLCGKPAVTFKIEGSGVNFVNLKDVTGLEVPNSDVEALKNAIVELATNDELYNKLAEGAYNRSHIIFNDEVFKSQNINLLK